MNVRNVARVMRKGTEEKVKLASAHSFAIQRRTLISPLRIASIAFIKGTSHAYSFKTWKSKCVLYIDQKCTLMPASISLINLIRSSFAFNCLSNNVSPRLKKALIEDQKEKRWNAHLLAQKSFDRRSKRKTWNAHLLAQRLSGVTKTRTARPAFGGRVRASQIYHNVNIRHLPRLLFPKACREEQDIEEAQLDRWWQRRRRGRRQQVSERQLESKFEEQKWEEKEAKKINRSHLT